MKRSILVVIVFGIFTLFQAQAHVQLNSPSGGETLTPGDTVIINWEIKIQHNTLSWELFFSEDGGLNWDTIKTGINKNSLTYKWVVPSTPTNKGKVRVVMVNSGSNYSDKSNDFTISGPSGIKDLYTPNVLNSFPNPMISYTWIEFNNHDKAVTLSLFNTNGKLVKRIENIHVNKVKLERGKLINGLYLFQIHSESEVLGNGNLLIQ